MTIIAKENFEASIAFWQAALALKKVHRCWQVTTRTFTYANPDHLFGLGIGHALDYLIGQRWLLKLPALPFLVGSRFLDLFEQEDAFRASCRHWSEAVKATHPVTILHSSPYAFRMGTPWYLKPKRLSIRIQRVALCTLDLAEEGFKLLMRIMDIFDLMTLDKKRLQQLLNQSTQEGGIHIPKCLDALRRNRDPLLQRLEAKKVLIDSVLKKLGARKTRANDVVTLATLALRL